jgi:hypothetical protein
MENVPVNIKSGVGGDYPQEGVSNEFISMAMSFVMTYIEKGMEYADKYSRLAGRRSVTIQDIKIGLRYAMFENWDGDVPEDLVEKMSGHYQKMTEELQRLEENDETINDESITDTLEDVVNSGCGGEENIEENEEEFTFADPAADDENFVRLAHHRVVAWEQYEPEDIFLKMIKKAVNTIQ